MDDSFEVTADAFVAMAHRIVWASVATVDRLGRPRSRVLHPYWQRDGELGAGLVGVIATSPTPIKRTHLEAHPYVSVNYWASDHDTCTAECTAEWLLDDEQPHPRCGTCSRSAPGAGRLRPRPSSRRGPAARPRTRSPCCA